MLYRRWWASSAGWKIKDSDHDCCLTWGLQLRVLRSSNFKLRFLCLCFGDGLRLDSWGRASRLPSDLDPASDWARTEFRYAEFARSQEGTPKPHQQRMIWVAPSFTRVSHKHLFPPHELYFHPHSHLLHPATSPHSRLRVYTTTLQPSFKTTSITMSGRTFLPRLFGIHLPSPSFN